MCQMGPQQAKKKQDEEKETSTEKQAESLENPKDNNVKTKSKKEAEKVYSSEGASSNRISVLGCCRSLRTLWGILVLATVYLVLHNRVSKLDRLTVKFWASDAFNLLTRQNFQQM